MSEPPRLVQLLARPRLLGLLGIAAVTLSAVWGVQAYLADGWPAGGFARTIAAIIVIGWIAGAMMTVQQAIIPVPTRLLIFPDTVIIVSRSLVGGSRLELLRLRLDRFDLAKREDYDGDQYFSASLLTKDGSSVFLFETAHRPTASRLAHEVADALELPAPRPI